MIQRKNDTLMQAEEAKKYFFGKTQKMLLRDI